MNGRSTPQKIRSFLRIWLHLPKKSLRENFIFCATQLLKDILENFERINRGSCPEVFCKKGALRNFTKSTGKHLCQSLFLNKVASLRPATLLKKRLWYRCFPVDFAKFLRTPFLQNACGRLLLIFTKSMKRTSEVVFWWNPGVDLHQDY